MINIKYDFVINLTTSCNLQCLACCKSIPYYKSLNWNFDLNLFKKRFHKNILQNTHSIDFTGNIGDVIFYPNLFELLNYISYYNKFINICFTTNGSAHDKIWWNTLAKCLNNFQEYHIYFSLDGLKKNHEWYRVGCKFEKVVQNAITFLRSNGKASIQYIQMSHNKKDYNILKRLSKLFDFYSIKIKYAWLSINAKKEYLDNNEDIMNTNIYLKEIQQNDMYCNWFDKKKFYITYPYYVLTCCFFKPNEIDDMKYDFSKVDLQKYSIRLYYIIQIIYIVIYLF